MVGPVQVIKYTRKSRATKFTAKKDAIVGLNDELAMIKQKLKKGREANQPGQNHRFPRTQSLKMNVKI